MAKTILVLGGSGFTGTPISKQLIQDGFALRLLVRQPEKARQIFGAGTEIISGEAQDAGTLAKALNGVDGVCINVPWKIEYEVTRQVIAILSKNGRKEVPVVYLSGVSVIPENRWYAMIEEKAKTEQLLETSGQAYTIFKPNWFMDSLKLFVRDGRATIFGAQKLPYKFVALEDFARLVSKAFQSPAARNQKIVDNGPEAFLMLDALQKYCDAAHPGIKASAMPIWFGKMLGALTGSAELKDVVGMMAYFEKVQHLAPENGNSLSSGPKLTFAEWLKRQK